MPMIGDVQEQQIKCVIQDKYRWICIKLDELLQRQCVCIRYITTGIFFVDIHQRALMEDTCPR